MARKRKKKKRGSSSDFGLSDGAKQSIFAITILALAGIFLLSFFGLAGSFGETIDDLLNSVFGWDRWLFGLVLLVIGWGAIFPDRRMLSGMNLFGITLFFIAFNGLLNLLFVDTQVYAGEIVVLTGGYIGLIVSQLIVGFLGFWGAFIIAIALMLVAILLTFNTSLHSILSVHSHFTSLGRAVHRRGHEDDYEDEEEIWEDDEESDEEDSEDEEYEDDYQDASSDLEAESIMTTARRRKMEIPIDLLDNKSSEAKPGDIDRAQEVIRRTFENFGIDVEMRDVKVGPSVTQYSLKPSEGVKLSRIVALHNDLALALAAHPIRIEAPIPGKSLVGIEVPNQSIGKVTLRELLVSRDFKRMATQYTSPLGKDVAGVVQSVLVDKAPHMLVAGATGSGKSVCLNIIITSLLYQNGPDDLKFVFVDPKRVELGIYTGIPHLLVPPITKVEEAINALKWAAREMERRLDHLAKFGVRDIDAYNKKSKERMPKIVIVIDELSDLMSQNKRDVEAVIVRIAQMSRAAGIHLILATQRPSVDVITGIIKANIPTRLAFAVASQVDSKTILDMAGAEKLLGRGDMLMTTPSLSKPKRVQGAYISDDEIKKIIKFLKQEGEPDYDYKITEDTRTGGTVMDSSSSDPLFDEAVQTVIDSGKASTSFLQRRLKIGYSRAARIIDIMEEAGIVGAQNGSKPREVLVDVWPPAGKRDEVEDVEELEEVGDNDNDDYGDDGNDDHDDDMDTDIDEEYEEENDEEEEEEL